MSTDELINIWLDINCEGYTDYFHDFVYIYCENGKILKTFPISDNEKILNGRMVPKVEVDARIRKYVDCDKVYYAGPSTLDQHNPYHDSVGELYICADSVQDYLKKWLLFIAYQKLQNNKTFPDEYKNVFERVCYQLIQEYNIKFGNAKNLLPLMENNYYTRKITENSIEMILYKFKAEMNYVKANNYFVLIEEYTGWCKSI